MTEEHTTATPPEIDLKNQTLAAALAWLLPGLGHFYQGRTVKGIIFAAGIIGLFVWGCFLAGSSEDGWGRAVYFQWEKGDRHWAFLG